jgi:hypothetical protein
LAAVTESDAMTDSDGSSIPAGPTPIYLARPEQAYHSGRRPSPEHTRSNSPPPSARTHNTPARWMPRTTRVIKKRMRPRELCLCPHRRAQPAIQAGAGSHAYTRIPADGVVTMQAQSATTHTYARTHARTHAQTQSQAHRRGANAWEESTEQRIAGSLGWNRWRRPCRDIPFAKYMRNDFNGSGRRETEPPAPCRPFDLLRSSGYHPCLSAPFFRRRHCRCRGLAGQRGTRRRARHINPGRYWWNSIGRDAAYPTSRDARRTAAPTRHG